jgi:hypothetical protein
VATVRERLKLRLRAIDDLEEGESAFGSGEGYWTNGKEILHFDSDEVVDVRLTRAEIRRRRAPLRADERVQLRPSSSSDWIEVRLAEPADIEFIVELAQHAAAAHRPTSGQAPRLPPTGPELEQRRRFH